MSLFKTKYEIFKRQDYSNILINNTKEKIKNIFQKCNKKSYKGQLNYSYFNNNNRHNRSLSKNLNQDSVISKIVDKLVIDNIHKISKNDLENNNFLGSNTTKEYNPYLKTNSKKDLNFPISASLKNIISINDINSLAISRHSAIMSSTSRIYSKKTSRQIKTNKPNRPNSNDNIKKRKNEQ